jgi:ribose transport system ATP-binding protein
VTVLRNGKVSGQADVADTSDDALIDMIIGRQRAPITPSSAHSRPPRRPSAGVPDRPVPPPAETPQLQVRGLSGGRIEQLDLAIRPGRVLGVAGLLGSGVEEIPYLLFGARPASAGTIAVQGDTCLQAAQMSPLAAMRAGIALVPADRAEHAGVGTVSVEENMLLLVERQFFRKGWRRRGSIRQRASARCESFDVRPRRPEATLGRLSGGNQQKVILAKWLEIAPRVIVLHEPTQGVDVGARADVYRLVQEATARTGACVLWVTTDFGELAQVCDRVLVVRNGRVSEELSGDAVSRESISQAVFGAEGGRVHRCDEDFAQRQSPVSVSSVR